METQRLDWCFYELFQICHWPRLLEPSVKMVGILLAYLQEVRISTSEDDGVAQTREEPDRVDDDEAEAALPLLAGRLVNLCALLVIDLPSGFKMTQSIPNLIHFRGRSPKQPAWI